MRLPKANEILMEEMAIYAERADVMSLLRHYLKRVLLDQPEDPIAYLIKEIEERPYRSEGYMEEADVRPESVRSRFMDGRSEDEKLVLLNEILSLAVKSPAEDVRRAELAVMLEANPSLLLEKFPKHKNELKHCVRTAQGKDPERLTRMEFETAALHALSLPGGR